MIALEVQDHADRRLVAHQRAVALVGLGDQQVRASGPGVAPQPFVLERHQVAPRDDGRVAPGAAQDLEDHRHDRGLAAGARHREGAVRRHEMGQQLRAMDHRYAARTRRGEVGHLLLDRGRDHERRGKLGRVRETRAVLGKDPDPEALELGA